MKMRSRLTASAVKALLASISSRSISTAQVSFLPSSDGGEGAFFSIKALTGGGGRRSGRTSLHIQR